MVPLSYNVRSLLARRATTVATMLGVALVVFVLAAVLMLVSGIEKTLQTTGSADKALVIRKGSDAELSSGIEDSVVKLVMNAPGVVKTDSGSKGVGELVVVAALEKVGDRGRVANVLIRGVPDNVLEFRPRTNVIEGRPARPGTGEVIVGKRIAGRFVGAQLGDAFELKKNRPVTVVGVFTSEGSAFESEVWADLDTVRTGFGRHNVVSSVTVQLESAAAFDRFKSHINGDKRLGLEVMRETTYYERQSAGTGRFIMAIGFVIAIFLAIGAMLGAMITMYGAVSQRRREIGTLRALGFSRPAILMSFLLESMVLALIGGIIGVIVALPMGFIKLSMMSFMTWSEVVFSFEPTPAIIVAAVISGSAMGILGGFFPAMRAALASPIEAMRD